MSLCPAFRDHVRSLWHQFSGQSRSWNLSWKICANSSALLVSLPANEATHVPWPRVWKLWQVLGAQFFGTIVLMKFVLKNPCQQLCIFSVAPCQRSYACPIAQRLQSTLKSLGHTVFRDNRIDGICPENTCQQLCILSMSLPPNKALPKLFPTVSFPFMMLSLPSRSLPTELSPSYFPRLPFRPLPSLPSHSLPTELSPSYFPRFPFRSWCRRPSQRSLPKLFPTVSFPFMMSSLPSRSLPTDLSPSYFPRFPFRSWYRRFRLAPSQRSSPQAISHGFLSVHDVVPSVSLHPRQRKLNENPSIGDTFGKKNFKPVKTVFFAQVARWLHLSGSNSTSEGVIDELLKGQSIFCRRSLRQLCSQLLLTSAMAQPG